MAAPPRPPPTIPWHGRMEARVAAGISLLVLLAMGAVFFATMRAVTNRSMDRASEDLATAHLTFTGLLNGRAESAATVTRLITELPVFRAYMTDSRLLADTASMEEMADRYRRQLNAQFCIVTDARGAWIGKPGWPVATRAPPALLAMIASAVAGQSQREMVVVEDRLFLLIAEPARFGGEVLGTLSVAYALDDAVAQQLAQTTHCEVNLVVGAHLCGSSLRGDDRIELERWLRDNQRDVSRMAVSTDLWQLGSERYVAGAFPLLPDRQRASPTQLILLRTWRPTQAFLDGLKVQFLGTSAIIFMFALVGGLMFSRSTSQPLREMAVAARDIAAGNLERAVPLRGSAEAATLATAFNHMSRSLREAQHRLVHDAFHDHLTQLPNRALFMDRLQRVIARQARHPDYGFAVLFIDLDRFKTVNDSIGHRSGDRLLLETASRITGVLRHYDVVSRRADVALDDDAQNSVARVGGDEFTVLLEDIRGPSDAVRIAERLQEAVALPVMIEGNEVFATVSIGIAVSSPTHRSGDDFVRDADIAMYRAKSAGGDQYAVFDATMHQNVVERLQLETDLRRALERHELRLSYQPIVSFATREVVGFEALLRWQHPDHGLLLPSTFLAVAEETGLIVRIDTWVLREACEEAARWQTASANDSLVSVSVNVSAKGFGQPGLVDLVASTLHDTGLNPRCLRLEITETVAMADAERTRAILTDIRALGVRISLDDFGTGYSSLSYLQTFPVDTLKIDRSFVVAMNQNSECREIIRTILSLAHTLGLDVIAEGAETAAQVDDLETLQCEFGQGYFFGRPMPAAELATLRKASAAPVPTMTATL